MGEKNKPNGILEILKAVVLGVFIYFLLQLSPIFFMPKNIANQPTQVVEEEPVYKNKSGKIVNVHDYNLELGYDTAKEEEFTTHAECKEKYDRIKEPFLLQGCHRYVTEQKNLPPKPVKAKYDSGKTTAECEAEIHAYWNPRVQDEKEIKGEHYIEQGNEDLYDCQNYDKARASKDLFEPIARLGEAIKKLEAGQSLSEQEKQTILSDIQRVKSYPANNNYNHNYFQELDRYFILSARLDSK